MEKLTFPRSDFANIPKHNMENNPGDISNLAAAAVYFGTATLVLGAIAALVLQALHEIGLRKLLNRAFLSGWFRQRRHPVSHEDISQSFGRNHLRQILNLPYRQLCGQFSAVLNMEVATGAPSDVALAVAELDREMLELPASSRPEATRPWDMATQKLSEVEARKLKYVGHRAEQGIDDLQARLATRWILANYLLSVVIISAIMAAPAESCTSDELVMWVATMRICSRRLFSLALAKRAFSSAWPWKTCRRSRRMTGPASMAG